MSRCINGKVWLAPALNPIEILTVFDRPRCLLLFGLVLRFDTHFSLSLRI